MLVAPLPSSVVRSIPPPPRAARRGPDLRRLLATWLAVGLGVLAAVPAARGDAQFGATLPFWLVAAPLIGLAWLQRAALAGFARRLRVVARGAPRRRQAQRLDTAPGRRRSVRAARRAQPDVAPTSADRSSST